MVVLVLPCALSLCMVLKSERLQTTAKPARHIAAKLKTLLVVAVCAWLAPQMTAQDQSAGAAPGNTKVIAPHRRSRPGAKNAGQPQRIPTSSSNTQKETQALLDDERAAVAGGDRARIEVTSKLLIASALRHFADLRILEHDYDQGVETYQAALLLQDDPPTRLKLGIADLRLKRKSEALAEADRVIASEPENAEAWKLKGNALAE